MKATTTHSRHHDASNCPFEKNEFLSNDEKRSKAVEDLRVLVKRNRELIEKRASDLNLINA